MDPQTLSGAGVALGALLIVAIVVAGAFTSGRQGKKQSPLVPDATLNDHENPVNSSVPTHDRVAAVPLADYNQLLLEVSRLKLKKSELVAALKHEQASHVVTRRRSIDLENRIDEEMNSYMHAKAYIEDLQNRLEEEISSNTQAAQTIEDLKGRIEEEVNPTNGGDTESGSSRSQQRVEDLQRRLEEEITSYTHARSYIEDLQNRLEEELQSVDALRRNSEDLAVRLDEEMRSNAELRNRMDNMLGETF